MKKLIVLLLLTSSFAALGQVPPEASKLVDDVMGFTQSQNDRKFAIVEYYDKVAPMDSFLVRTLITDVRYVNDGSVTYQHTPPDTAILYLSQTGRPLNGTVTWKYADQNYDTVFTEKEKIDDYAGASSRWSVVNMSKAINSPKPQLTYNKTFTFVTTTASAASAKIITTGDAFEFFSERYPGHGNVRVFVDGQQVHILQQGIEPFGTDFERMVPSFRWIFPKATPTSPATEHTIEFKTDPGTQFIVDMLRVLNYTLKPR